MNDRGNTVWMYEIGREGERLAVAVERAVAPGDAVVEDADGVARAIETQGASAVEAFLGEDAPPTRLQISPYGVVQYVTTIRRRRRWFRR